MTASLGIALRFLAPQAKIAAEAWNPKRVNDHAAICAIRFNKTQISQTAPINTHLRPRGRAVYAGVSIQYRILYL